MLDLGRLRQHFGVQADDLRDNRIGDRARHAGDIGRQQCHHIAHVHKAHGVVECFSVDR